MRYNCIHTIVFAFCLARLSSAQSSNDTEDVIWNMHNYNGWDVPFAKTVYFNSTESEEFPTANYIMNIDPNAYFSLVFVSVGHFDIRDKDLKTLNYTFFGSSNYNFTGIWLTMDMAFNKDVI